MNVRFVPYELALTRPYAWAKGRQARRRGLLVRIEADDVVGWGEVAPPPHEDAALDDLAAAGTRWCAGIDPLADTALRALDNRATDARVRAGIATAVLDVQARIADVPLATWVARRAGHQATVPDDVPVNALITAGAPDETAAAAREAVAAGFTCLKIKCGADGPARAAAGVSAAGPGDAARDTDAMRAADLARVAAVRGAAPDALLRLDANEAWDAEWAADHLLAVADAAGGIDYVEQPLPAGGGDALLDLARLRAETGVRVALDEAVHGPTDVQAIVAAEAADVLILKPQRLGGPDRAYQMMRMGHAAGLDCTVTNSLETAIGRAAAWHVAALGATPGHDPPPAGLATDAFLADDVADGPRPVRGRLAAPPGPGLGVEARA